MKNTTSLFQAILRALNLSKSTARPIRFRETYRSTFRHQRRIVGDHYKAEAKAAMKIEAALQDIF